MPCFPTRFNEKTMGLWNAEKKHPERDSSNLGFNSGAAVNFPPGVPASPSSKVLIFKPQLWTEVPGLGSQGIRYTPHHGNFMLSRNRLPPIALEVSFSSTKPVLSP